MLLIEPCPASRRGRVGLIPRAPAAGREVRTNGFPEAGVGVSQKGLRDEGVPRRLRKKVLDTETIAIG